jgi:hypothetical protein
LPSAAARKKHSAKPLALGKEADSGSVCSSIPSKESDTLSPHGDSAFQEDCHDTTVVHHLLSNHEASVGVSQPVGQGIAISSPLSSYIFLYSLLNVYLGIAIIL